MATDPEWKQKVFVGGLVLMIPVVGWPAVLGYRKVVIEHLVDGTTPLLPPWRGRFWIYVAEGLKAIFVIYCHFLPVMIWFACRAGNSVTAMKVPWIGLGSFFLAFPIFSPLAIPLLVTYLVWFVPQPMVSPWEWSLMIGLYSALTFVIPAGFLRVSQQKRFVAAFHFPENLRLIASSFATYCEAWVGSIGISLLGHFAIPLSPWGIVWCYLGIVYAFNEVPWTAAKEPKPSYLAKSWIAEFQRGFLNRYQCVQRWLTRIYSLPGADRGIPADHHKPRKSHFTPRGHYITDPDVQTSRRIVAVCIWPFEVPIG